MNCGNLFNTSCRDSGEHHPGSAACGVEILDRIRPDLFLNLDRKNAERKKMKIRTEQAPKQDFVVRQIGTETIVVPVRGGVGDLNAIYTLNEAGTNVWQMMRAGKAVPEIINSLCENYDISAEEATRDTMEFIENLRHSGLLKEAAERNV